MRTREIPTCLVVAVSIHICGGKCSLEYQANQTARCPDEQEWPPPELVNEQSCPCIAENGQCGPTCIEKERHLPFESKRGVDQNAVVGQDEGPYHLIEAHQHG